MARFPALALILLAACMPVAQPAEAGPYAWPDGKTAAVVLTYDDSLDSHLDIALPQLDAAGLKGTFYLKATFDAAQLPRWRAAAAHGHELGNHSVFHPCQRGTFDMPEPRMTENYTVATMLEELSVMNTFLTAIDGKTEHTFGVPCGNGLAGGEDYIGPAWDAGLFSSIRGIAWPENDPEKIALSAVPSEWFPEDATGADMIGAVKRVEADGGLLVLGFHGVGGDYLTVPAASHQALVDYLAANKDRIWVTTFAEATDWIATQASGN